MIGCLILLVVFLALDLLLLMYCRPRRGAGIWVLHTKVDVFAFSSSIDKKIFQNVLPICWWERFFADSAI
jgi:hypothetical protein